MKKIIENIIVVGMTAAIVIFAFFFGNPSEIKDSENEKFLDGGG